MPFSDSRRARLAGHATVTCATLVFGAQTVLAQASAVHAGGLLPKPWQQAASHDSTHSAPSWMAPVASAFVPGAGQLLRGEDRGAIYFIAEAFLLQRFVSLWTDARRDEKRYREIALKVARAPFAPNAQDTVFEYFEQMGKFIASGPYDTDAGPELIPPTDEATYNGAIWALARRTYFTGNGPPPETSSLVYQSALAFYRRRAIGPNYQWSWQSAGIEQDLFRQTIRQGDETFRRATEQLGLLLANHFLSAVDAFVSQRLSRGRRVELDHRFSLPGPSRTTALGVILRVNF